VSLQVAVVGAGGRMGSWFVDYFLSRKVLVTAFDSRVSALKNNSPNVRIAEDISSCVRDADFVLICVPVRATPGVIRQCSRYMKASGVLAEISSVKHKTLPALSRIRGDLTPICIHPMFGPGAKDTDQMKMLLVPVRSERDELKSVQEYFAHAVIMIIHSAREHDEGIGVVLGLTYFCNLVLADIISRKSRALLNQVAGTTFRVQLVLTESILTDDPELISALIRDNPFAQKQIGLYLKKADSIKRLMRNKSPAKLEKEIRKLTARMVKNADLKRSYFRLYSASRSMGE
jgi:prephenate dehydrogenase